MSKKHPTRREVIKRAVYVAPAIVSLAAMPSFAMAGSGRPSTTPPPPPPPTQATMTTKNDRSHLLVIETKDKGATSYSLEFLT